MTKNVRYPWLIATLLFVLVVINNADKAVFGLSAIPLMQEFNLSHAEFGLVAGSFFYLFSIVQIIGSFLSDRFPTRWMLMAMAVIWSLVQLPMIGMVSLATFQAARIALGAAEGATMPVVFHGLHKWFPDEQRPLPTAFVSAATAVGAGLMAPVVTFLIVTYSWHFAYFTLGLASAIWFLVWLVLGHEGPYTSNEALAEGRMEARIPFRRLLLSRTIIACTLNGFGAYWCLTVASIWLPTYLAREVGYTPTEVGWIMTLPSIGSVLFSFVFAYLSQWLLARGVSQRLGRGVVAAACVSAAGLALFLLPLAAGTILPIVCVAIAFSIGTVTFTLGPSIAGHVSPVSQRGASFAVSIGGATLAGFFAATAVGKIVDIGTTTAGGFESALMLSGALVMLLGIVGMVLVDPEGDVNRFTNPAAAVLNPAE